MGVARALCKKSQSRNLHDDLNCLVQRVHCNGALFEQMLQENHDFHSPRILFRYLLPLWLLVATSFVRCFHQSAAGHNDDIIIYYGNAMHC